MSREVSAVLDVNDVIPHHYSLEVSSPGLDRPLRTLAHFERFVGQKARIRLKGQGVDGRRNFSGPIKRVDVAAQAIMIDVDGKEFALPFSSLDKATLVYEFPRKSAEQ